jgi:transaldolase
VELYLDTGDPEDVRKAVATGLISGVTTNPSLIARAGKELKSTILEICALLSEVPDSTVSAEVYAKDAQGMVEEGRALAAWNPHVIVKVPATRAGLLAVQELRRNEIRCNVTLCFSLEQALLAAKAGAFAVSPFVGRIDDAGGDGIALVREIKQVFENYGFDTRLLVASVRSVEHVRKAALIGADIATLPPNVFDELFRHPLTDKGIALFEADAPAPKRRSG